MSDRFFFRNHNGTKEPWMIYTIIGINTLLYVLQLYNKGRRVVYGEQDEEKATGLARLASFTSLENMTLIPGELYQNTKQEWPNVLKSMFGHASFTHLFYNVLALYEFGRPIEDTWGPWRTLFLYMVSGIGSNLVYSIRNRDSHVGVIGASGSIAGVAAAYFLQYADTKNMTTWLLYQIVGALLASNSGIGFSSHLYGFGFGALIYFLLGPKKPNLRQSERP